MFSNQPTQEVVKYSTQLPPELIKWVKLQAIQRGVKDYHLIQQALEAYRAKLEDQQTTIGIAPHHQMLK
jgi:hypothetical protein